MGNWHCIPSSCAEVVYQEYLPPSVRWRYGNEAWQEIVGDDYKFEGQPEFPQTEPKAYRIWAKAKILSRVPPPPDTVPPQPIEYNAGQEILCTVNTFFQSPIWSVKPITNSSRGWLWEVTHTPTVDGNQFRGNCVKQTISFPVGTPKNGGLQGLTSQANSAGPGVSKFYDWYLVEDKTVTLRQCINQQNFNCTFTITKNGQTVHTETRSVCPEVEKLPCRLSDEVKRIEINKLPFLEKVEVVPYAYSAHKVPGVGAPIPQADPIPSNCLNIYNNAIFVIPPPVDALKDPDAVPFDSFIDQICSAFGCPPPQYQVLCDSCGCENCPPGTRAVTCANSVCCYNSDGISIKEISASDYCGSGDCE